MLDLIAIRKGGIWGLWDPSCNGSEARQTHYPPLPQMELVFGILWAARLCLHFLPVNISL